MNNIFKDYKEDRKKKRWHNDRSSRQILDERHIEYEILDAGLSHYRVGDFNFWGTTGKFYNQKTGQKGRGIFNLLRIIGG